MAPFIGDVQYILLLFQKKRLDNLEVRQIKIKIDNNSLKNTDKI